MDSDDEPIVDGRELQMIEKDWERRSEMHYKEGFVQGSLLGQKEATQPAFNAGFKQGFWSTFLLGKLEGIINAVITYQMNHTSSEFMIQEAYSLLEEIHSLLTNCVADDFLKTSLGYSSNGGFPDDIVSKFSAMLEHSDARKPIDNCEMKPEEITPAVFTAVDNLSQERVDTMLLQCPSIKLIDDKCKQILKCLKWSGGGVD